MKAIVNIERIEDFEQLVETSATKPVLILKHSSACPISAAANRAFEGFVRDAGLNGAGEDRFEAAMVLVIENRPVSLCIAERTQVAHQSPQLLLIKGGQAVWSCSHWKITRNVIAEALAHETV